MGVITLANQRHTMLELAKRTNNGNLIAITEVLSQTNNICLDAPWFPANGEVGHKIARRTALPSGTWRKINDGVGKGNSRTEPYTETIGLLEAFSEIDAELVGIAPDPLGYRSSEDLAWVEGLSQNFADTLMYGNTVAAPEQFKGLAPRVNALSNTNVIGGSGTGSDCTSIWVVQWGPKKAYMVYPKSGAPGGIGSEDLGRQRVAGETAGTTFMAYVTHFTWRGGLVVEDDRCIQRYANIETAGTSNLFNADKLITILNRLPYNGAGAVIYCNGTIKTQMDIAAQAKSNVNYGSSEIWGAPVTTFRGVPVRQVDAILNTETAIS